MSYAYDLWAINNTSNTLQGINTKTLELSTPIPLGYTGFSLAFNPSTGILWTSAYLGGDFVGIIPLYINTLQIGEATSIYSANTANNFFINNYNNMGFLLLNSGIVPINLNLLEGYNIISGVDSLPYTAIINNLGTEIWNVDRTTITIVNTSTMLIQQTLTISGDSYYMAITPDGKTVWTANYSNSTIQSIDTQLKTITKSINITAFIPNFVVPTPDGNTLWIIGSGGTENYTYIQPLDLNTLTLGTATEFTNIILCELFKITFTIANNILWFFNISNTSVTCSSTGIYGINLKTFEPITPLLTGDAISAILLLPQPLDPPKVPNLIHNLLNCTPVTDVLSNEIGVDK